MKSEEDVNFKKFEKFKTKEKTEKNLETIKTNIQNLKLEILHKMYEGKSTKGLEITSLKDEALKLQIAVDNKEMSIKEAEEKLNDLQTQWKSFKTTEKELKEEGIKETENISEIKNEGIKETENVKEKSSTYSIDDIDYIKRKILDKIEINASHDLDGLKELGDKISKLEKNIDEKKVEQKEAEEILNKIAKNFKDIEEKDFNEDMRLYNEKGVNLSDVRVVIKKFDTLSDDLEKAYKAYENGEIKLSEKQSRKLAGMWQGAANGYNYLTSSGTAPSDETLQKRLIETTHNWEVLKKEINFK